MKYIQHFLIMNQDFNIFFHQKYKAVFFFYTSVICRENLSGSTNNKEFLVENFSISIMGLEHFSPRGGSIRGDFCLEVALEDIMLPEK